MCKIISVIKSKDEMDRKSWIVAVVLLFAAAMLAGWLLTLVHNSRMNEGFTQVRAEQKSVAFVTSVKQAESFYDGSAPLAPPASLQQERKTSVYLNNGLITFIGSENNASGIQSANANYLIFFHPTQSDLQCDFTNISTPSSCISPLDTLSTNDTAIQVPASIKSAQPYAISAPNADLDTRVYVLGSVYNLSRISIDAHCWGAPYRIPSPTGAPRVFLALPRADYATRLIFLLRPTYIRAASSGVAASMLYWIEWDHTGLDGTTYQSQFDAPNGVNNAVLSLVQVAGFDNDGMIDPVVSPPLPSFDLVLNGGTSLQPIASEGYARQLKIRSGSTTSLVLYYPKYSMPSPMSLQASGQIQMQQVATVYASVITGSFVSLADGNGNVVISVTVPGGRHSVATVTVPAAGGTTFSVPIPTGSPAYVVACAVHDIVTIAVFTPKGTTVSSMQLVTSLNYYPGTAGTLTYGGGAQALTVGNYTSTSVPNFADIALSLGCLPLPPSSPSSGIAVENFENDTVVAPRSSLKQGEALLPGQTVASQSGAYVAIYQLDGQLAVYETKSNVMVWSSGIGEMPVTAGKCVLGKDGVLKLFAGGVNRTQASSAPYWSSVMDHPPGPDQAPFALVVADSPPGQIQIIGKFSATPVWAS